MNRLFFPASALCLCLVLWAGQVPAQPLDATDTSGWNKAEFRGTSSYLYPPDFLVTEQDENDYGVAWMNPAAQQHLIFGFTKDKKEAVFENLQQGGDVYQPVGPVTVGGQAAQRFHADIDRPVQNMTGVMEVVVFDAPYPDGDSLAIMLGAMNLDWAQSKPLLDRMLSTVTIDPASLVSKAAAPAPATTTTSQNADKWIKGELGGAAFLYPANLDIIEQDNDNLAVGKLDEATHKGLAFGFTVDDRDSLLRDIQRDATSFEELGPASINGQMATHYRATVNDPSENMVGTMEIILFDAPLTSGESLAVMQMVVNQEWSEHEDLLRRMLFSVTLDEAMFAPAPTQAPEAPMTGLEGLPQPPVLPGVTPAPTPTPTPAPAISPTPSPAATTDTSGWTRAEFMTAGFLYPPDFQNVEERNDGIMVGRLDEATREAVIFSLGKDDLESLLKDMKNDSETFEELGALTVDGQPATLYRVTMNKPEESMVGTMETIVFDTTFADGESLMIMFGGVNTDWEANKPLLETILSTVTVDPAMFLPEEDAPAPGAASAAYRNGSITLKDARSYRDAVGRGEKLEPDGAPDARFILIIQGPGVLTGVRLHNMDGMHADWDTTPGNEAGALAVYKGRELLNAADGTLRADLAEGDNKLDLFVQDNNAIAGGQTTLEVNLEFGDGSSWSGMIFQ